MGNYVAIADIDFWPAGWEAATKEAVISRVEEYIERVCGDRFYSFSETVTVNGSGKRELHHGQPYRLSEVSAIEINGSAVDADDYSYDEWTIWRKADYSGSEWWANYGPVFSAGIRNVEIAGVWGHDSTPESIKRAAILLVQYELSIMGEASPPAGGVAQFQSERMGNYSYSRAGQAGPITPLPEVDRLLGPWIKARIRIA